MARFAHLYQVPIQECSVDVRGRFQATEKYDIDEAPASFEKVSFVLDVRSSAPPDAVRRLIAHAERGCHSVQTVRNPVPVELRASLNDAELDMDA